MPPLIQKPESVKDRKQYWMNLTLAGAAGQVGCMTLVIIIVAVLGGLWLDAHLNTKPVFTFVFLVASIPVSLVAMLKIVRLVTSKMKINPSESDQDRKSSQPPGSTSGG